jgi:hypothetical protein
MSGPGTGDYRPGRPLAVEMFEQFLGGRSIASLAEGTGIPYERVEIRVRAAAALAVRRGAGVMKPGAVIGTATGHLSVRNTGESVTFVVRRSCW